MRPSLQAQRQAVRRKKLISIAVLIGGLGVIGAVGFAFRPEPPVAPAVAPVTSQPEPAPEPSLPPGLADLGISDPTAVAPMEVLPRAKTRALAWSDDSVLVGISAKPVVRGRVDLASGGSIEFVFGTPTGQGFGAGARVKATGLSVRIGAEGAATQEQVLSVTQAAAEPNCTLTEAARTLSAAGVAEDTPLDMTYAYSARHERTVWRAAAPDGAQAPRIVDGWTCAIVVR